MLSILPVDILKLILEEYHRLDAPITPLMVTCKFLYHLIHDTPRLWGRILVSLDSMPASLKLGSTIACQEYPLLDKSISLSKSCTIEATLVIGQVNMKTSPTSKERADRFKALMKESRRITFLCVIINPDTSIEDVIESFKGIFTGTFDVLESLMIASAVPLPSLLPAFDSLFKCIDDGPNKLTSLYLENLQTEFIMGAAGCQFWRQLRRVTLKGEYHPLPASVFRGCSKLDFLSFSGELLVTSTSELTIFGGGTIPAQPPGSTSVLSLSTDPIPYSSSPTLTQIQWLRLGAVTMLSLSHLQLSRVRFLVIQTALRDYTSAPPAPYTVILPELEVLHIAAVHSEVKCIVAPKLQTLCLQIQALKHTDANKTVNNIFDGHESMWRPKNFSIRAPIYDKHLVELLKRLPDLESVTLILQDIPKATLLAALCQVKILPNLKTLSFDLQTMTKGEESVKKRLDAKIQEIARFRERRHNGLKWLSWKWGSEEEVVVVSSTCPGCIANDVESTHVA